MSVMLRRTANNLFWLARYMERLDYVARLLDVAHRMSVLGGTKASSEWRSAIIASGSFEAFDARHDEANPETVTDWLGRDRANPSSLIACLSVARENARAVRGSLTADVWEALNTAFLEAGTLDEGAFAAADLVTTLEWVKRQSTLFNGAYTNTMLRQEPYYFVRLGTFVERADNVVRLLDVKYHVLLPGDAEVGGTIDFYQWISILRAVAARRAYHFLYSERVKPWLVAELLLLRPEMPRSLHACYQQIVAHLDLIAEAQGGRTGPCHQSAGEMLTKLRYGKIDDIFQTGLHEFLTTCVDRSLDLGREIEAFYFS